MRALVASSAGQPLECWNLEPSMRRRDTLRFLVAAAAAWPFGVCAQPPDRRRTPGAFDKAGRDYAKISRPTEANRLDYITRLVRLREQAAKTDQWQAIDAEIKRHPAPA